MSEIKDIFGIGDRPVKSGAVQDEKNPDALSFFGVPKDENENKEE